jgi:hypothetical protein
MLEFASFDHVVYYYATRCKRKEFQLYYNYTTLLYYNVGSA